MMMVATNKVQLLKVLILVFGDELTPEQKTVLPRLIHPSFFCDGIDPGFKIRLQTNPARLNPQAISVKFSWTCN